MEECAKGPSNSCRPMRLTLEKLENRKVILLATATIHNESLFVNGLFQNVFILYKLFESMGYAPILLVDTKPSDITKVPNILRHTRMITGEDIVRFSIPIHLHIEIAMSIDCETRKYLRDSGTKTVKLYLGNILNIDIETAIFYTNVHFTHHVTGELDEIWVSPHYKQHTEYAGLINNINPAKIAPYVWDPCILTHDGSRRFRWIPKLPDDPYTLVILEPNISFQKCSLIPLLIAEKFYRTGKNVKVILGNSDNFKKNMFFTKTILPTLSLYKDNKIIFNGRNTLPSIMSEYPSAFAICHHWNNEYNYMTLEYLHARFPVIHNARDWSDGGYFYNESNIDEGFLALKTATLIHEDSIERYSARAEVVRWRHSIYNPEVQREWSKLLV
jgi:hypothetical protein